MIDLQEEPGPEVRVGDGLERQEGGEGDRHEVRRVAQRAHQQTVLRRVRQVPGNVSYSLILGQRLLIHNLGGSPPKK